MKEVLILIDQTTQNETQRRKVMAEIVDQVKETHVGGVYKFSDFLEDVE